MFNMYDDVEIVLEMYERGFKFLPIDLNKSDATKFKVEDECLRPPFNSISGMGNVAAESIYKAAHEETPISSIDNLKKVIKDFVKFKSSYELSVNKFNKNAQYLIDLCTKVKKVYSVPEDLAAYCTKIVTTLEIEITHNFATFNDFIEYKPNIFANFTDKYGTDLVSLYPIEEISKMYIIVQTYYYLCIKKKTLLFDSYLTIRNNAETFGEKTIFYQNDKMKEKIHKKNLFQGTKNYLVLPKEHKILVKIGTKLFGGFLILISFVLYFVQIFMLVISLLSKESRIKVNDFLNVNDSTILIIIFFGYFSFIILASACFKYSRYLVYTSLFCAI